MALEYTLGARADMRSIFRYIARDDMNAAERTIVRIRGALDNLNDMPLMGRTGLSPGTRELVVPGTPYLAVYRLTGADVQILRIIHGAQDWPR